VLRRWRIECSAADAASSSAGASDESPYQVLGVSPLEKFDTIKATYRRKHKDAERQGNEAAMARVCNYLFFQCPNVVDLLSDHIS
jgi:DnaJ-domain-containing protein 1